MADRRGKMTRSDRQMSDVDARGFLREHVFAHVGTIDPNGWPYVVPLLYVYEAGDRLYLHTGNREGHFIMNIGTNTKVCIAVSEPGPLQAGTPSACNGSLVYKSAIVFGNVRVCDGPELDARKTWFFDRLLPRLGDDKNNYTTGYTMLHHITLYEVQIEILTGKFNTGMHH
jgi:nitroimidazol reductase NimA-like FMN-containing flavoprotein (pyridoxamine 5'-phosphate oxidase superfamily)